MEWKGIGVYGIVIMVLSIGFNAGAQNLVPNGCFDYSDTCSTQSIEPYDEIDPWFRLLGSADYLHPCFHQEYSVPQSTGGGGQPSCGQGYIGISCYVTAFLGREFITVELTEPLSTNVNYKVRFRISRMDSCWYATKNVGVYLSNDVPAANLTNLLNLEPQVKYEDNTFITDIHGWTRIEGALTATGGERYLTIGNFDDDENTDTLFVPGGGAYRPNQPDFWKTAYYYVDGVSLVPDSIYLGAGDLEEQEPTFNLYPNPNTGEFNILLSLEEDEEAMVSFWSINGQLVFSLPLTSGNNSLRLDVANGLYLYMVTVNGERKWTGKVSISTD